MSKKTFVIVSNSEFHNSIGILYRRNKFANYLLNRGYNVIWLYSIPIRPWNDVEYKGAIKRFKTDIKEIETDKSIVEVGIPDLLPSSLVTHIKLLQSYFIKKLNMKIMGIKNKSLIYTYPAFKSLIDLDNWNKIVYDRSDNWTGGKVTSKSVKSKISSYLVDSTEEYIMINSDIIFCTSKFLYEKSKSYNDNSYLIENGVYIDDFINAKQNSNLKVKSPSLGFVGGLKFKINYNLLNFISEKKPGWNIVLIGPKNLSNQEDKISFENLIGNENVKWIGKVAPDEVPGYLSNIDVGLLPYKNIDYNKGVFPIKFYEYLASDMPIVGTGLPSTAAHQEKGVYAYTEGDFEDYLEECKKAINWLNNDEFIDKRFNRSKEGDWENKFEFMLNKILS